MSLKQDAVTPLPGDRVRLLQDLVRLHRRSRRPQSPDRHRPGPDPLRRILPSLETPPRNRRQYEATLSDLRPTRPRHRTLHRRLEVS